MTEYNIYIYVKSSNFGVNIQGCIENNTRKLTIWGIYSVTFLFFTYVLYVYSSYECSVVIVQHTQASQKCRLSSVLYIIIK
jgi:hypothetical protein